MAIVLYGSTASMVVDLEETCFRLGLTILAIVKNVEGVDYALDQDRIIWAEDITPEVTSCPFIIPIFTPGHRLAALRDATARGLKTSTTLIDPSATVAHSTTLGAGTYVNAAAVVGGASRLGEFGFINRGANIGHHVTLADFVSIGPGGTVCGAARIGRGTVIGAGAVILPAVEVGANSVIAAGTVLREPVGDHCLVAGNPGRVVRADYPGYRNLSV